MQQAVAAPEARSDSPSDPAEVAGGGAGADAGPEGVAFAPPIADRVDVSSGGQHEDASMPTYLGESSSLGSVAPAAARPKSAWVIAAVLGLLVAGGVTWAVVGSDGERRRGSSAKETDGDEARNPTPDPARTAAGREDPGNSGAGTAAEGGAEAEVSTGEPGPASATVPSSGATATAAMATEPTPKKRPKPRPTVKKKALATATPASTSAGRLLVRVDPWASVYVDGKLRGTAPMPPLVLPPGSYEVRLVNPHVGRNETVRVVIRSGGTTRITRSWR
jgi:hypothetical protein